MIPGANCGSTLTGIELIGAVLDPNVHKAGYPDVPALTNGNLTIVIATGYVLPSAASTVGRISGKRYFEGYVDHRGYTGGSFYWGLMKADGTRIFECGPGSVGSTWGFTNDGAGDVTYTFNAVDFSTFGVLADLDAGSLTLTGNGAEIFTRDIIVEEPVFPYLASQGWLDPNTPIFSFHPRPDLWAYDPGAGWSAWEKEL